MLFFVDNVFQEDVGCDRNFTIDSELVSAYSTAKDTIISINDRLPVSNHHNDTTKAIDKSIRHADDDDSLTKSIYFQSYFLIVLTIL